MRLRVLVHALDRTGPPVLARTFLRWLRGTRPDIDVDVVAVRGGALVDDLSTLGSVTVVLDPFEPGVPRSGPRAQDLHARLVELPAADVTLLVSVAAGQVLPLLGRTGPVATWVVEAGEDLHWMEAELGLRERTSRWLAGSETSKDDVAALVEGHEVHLVPEFIEVPDAPTATARRADREGEALCVVGAGIGTWRKAPDLFAEVALAHHRRTPHATTYHWVGGETDDLLPSVRAEVERLGPPTLRFEPSVPDLAEWFARADVLVHPARLDSFPLVCLQAAASGVPVAGFDASLGLPEMFGEAFLGACYPDIEGLAATIESLRSPQTHAHWAAAQQRRVRERFTVERRAPTLLAHLLDLAARNGSEA